MFDQLQAPVDQNRKVWSRRFFGFGTLSMGRLIHGYLPEVEDLCFRVRPQAQRWGALALCHAAQGARGRGRGTLEGAAVDIWVFQEESGVPSSVATICFRRSCNMYLHTPTVKHVSFRPWHAFFVMGTKGFTRNILSFAGHLSTA